MDGSITTTELQVPRSSNWKWWLFLIIVAILIILVIYYITRTSTPKPTPVPSPIPVPTPALGTVNQQLQAQVAALTAANQRLMAQSALPCNIVNGAYRPVTLNGVTSCVPVEVQPNQLPADVSNSILGTPTTNTTTSITYIAPPNTTTSTTYIAPPNTTTSTTYAASPIYAASSTHVSSEQGTSQVEQGNGYTRYAASSCEGATGVPYEYVPSTTACPQVPVSSPYPQASYPYGVPNPNYPYGVAAPTPAPKPTPPPTPTPPQPPIPTGTPFLLQAKNPVSMTSPYFIGTQKADNHSAFQYFTLNPNSTLSFTERPNLAFYFEAGTINGKAAYRLRSNVPPPNARMPTAPLGLQNPRHSSYTVFVPPGQSFGTAQPPDPQAYYLLLPVRGGNIPAKLDISGSYFISNNVGQLINAANGLPVRVSENGDIFFCGQDVGTSFYGLLAP